MSVSIEGVKGYEYQYKVSLLISLLNLSIDIELYIEKKGSEDATLRFGQDLNKKVIEIQVKHEKSNIDTEKIISWLCHFQEQKTNNNLLHRIIENKTITLFVTPSRCSDDTVFFKNNINNINTQDKIQLSRKWKNNFIDILSKMTFGDTDLMLMRQSFCKDQAKSLQKTDLSRVLCNIIIWEEVFDENLDYEIPKILNSKFQIAQSNAENVYASLLDIVKKNRGTEKNIIPDIKKLINKNKIGKPQISNNYQPRFEEEELKKYLNAKNILLLTGTSLCGKSEIAKKLSLYFYENGFDFRRTDDVEEILRFYSINPLDNKIAILEDPFGHLSLTINFEIIKSKIIDLVNNIQSNHKIIITSRREILFELFETQDLNRCSLKGINWVDLTITDNSIINKFWLIFADKETFPNNIKTLVSNNLLKANSTIPIQIGQLISLANEESSFLYNKNYNELEHLARRNSKEIAHSLREKDEFIAELMSIISLCATQIHGVNKIELAYILSSCNEKLSLIDKTSFTSSFTPYIPEFPQYPKGIYLTEETEKALEYLEERHLINIENNEIRYTHPDYYEAGRYLFFTQSERKQRRFLVHLIKCISCLNPKNSFLASGQFLFIYNKIKRSLQRDLVKIAFESINSIFPSVEDSSLIFLMNILEDINEESADSLVRYIQNGGTSSSDIYWHDNRIPYISNRGNIFNWLVESDNVIVKKVEHELSKNTLPNIYDAWIYIHGLKNETPIKIDYLRFLLNYDEAFIRKEVVTQIFKRINGENYHIVSEVFSDQHPTVVFAAIRSSLSNWSQYPVKAKEYILPLIIESLKKKHVAIRAFKLISTFSIDYDHDGIRNWDIMDSSEKRELWNVWGKLYPITVQNLPLNIYINTARFGATMDEAVKYIDLRIGIKVLETWLERIDYQIKNGKVLDEYELAIAHTLMRLTKTNSNVRKDLFFCLLNYNDTSFLLSNLKWIIEVWGNLSKREKNQVIKLIKSDRKDSRWIKAVLMNSYSPPEDICFCMIGEKSLSEDHIEDVISKFPNQLLLDCLNVYCGFPQPLWWLAVHHKNEKFWGKVIRYILLKESHIGFDTCLQEFLSFGVNGFGNEWTDWEMIWKEVCDITIDKTKLFNSLIFNTARCTCNIQATKKLWAHLIDSYSKQDKEKEIVNLISDNIELLQQTNNKEDILKYFDSKWFINKILHQLYPDIYIINLLMSYEINNQKNASTTKYFLEELAKLIGNSHIRFYGTFNMMENSENEKIMPEEIILYLKNLPNTIKVVGEKRLSELEMKFNYKLDNWIGIN